MRLGWADRFPMGHEARAHVGAEDRAQKPTAKRVRASSKSRIPPLPPLPTSIFPHFESRFSRYFRGQFQSRALSRFSPQTSWSRHVISLLSDGAEIWCVERACDMKFSSESHLRRRISKSIADPFRCFVSRWREIGVADGNNAEHSSLFAQKETLSSLHVR